MELLVGLIAEFIIAIVFPIVAIIFQAIFGLIAFISYHVFGYAIAKSSRGAPSPVAAGSAGSASLHPMVSRGLLIGTAAFGGLFATGLVGAVVANFFFLVPTVTWITGKISEHSAIEISFENADGNLLTGNLFIETLEIQRRNSDKTEYVLSINTIDLDVAIWSLVFGTPTLSSLTIEGVDGQVWNKGETPRDVSMGESGSNVLEPRKEFEITSLDISNVELIFHKEDSPALALDLDSLKSSPLRSHYAVFDIFFRSNISGRINESEILIATEGNDDGRATQWRLNNFPADLVGYYVDKAPFKWFESGFVDITVEDTWSQSDVSEIDMDWRFVFKGVEVVNPPDTNFVSRAIAGSVARYINDREDDIDLRFQLVMNEEQFKTKSSLNAAGLWEAVMNGTAKAIAEKSDSNVGQVKDRIKGSLNKAKGFLDRKRIKDEENLSE